MSPQFISILFLFLAACATAPTAPEVSPEQVNEFLVDPRLAISTPASRSIERQFETAWRLYRSGRLVDAEREFTALLQREPAYGPAELGLAAILITRADYDGAEQHIARAAQALEGSPVIEMYRGEVARGRGDLRRAYEIYSAVVQGGLAPPKAAERLDEIRNDLFNQLFAQASAASDPEITVRVLREALAVNGESTAARRLLVQRLIETRRFDEAQRELDPLLKGGGEDEDVQQLLAEIDAGKGRYQEAIGRYERLVRRSEDSRFRARLEQIKQDWREANMPPQQRRATESAAISREDLAVLIYWNLPAVRFGRNLGEPPIAVDIADVVGREELIRSMSLRLFSVDPVTRRVEPYRLVSAGSLLRILARLVNLRGTPSCASEAVKEPNELLRALRTLELCGIDASELVADLEAPVRGRTAERALLQIAALLKSGEERQARQ